MKLKTLLKKQVQKIKFSKFVLKSKLREKILKIRKKKNKNNIQINFKKVFDIIKKERLTGHEHRLPKKINKSSRSNSLTEAPKNNCLINVNKLQNQIIYIDTGCELDTSAGTD